MTNPEVKVSEKARELAENVLVEGVSGYDYEIDEQIAAKLIQAALSELLEAGRELATWHSESNVDDFLAILSKWEPK